MTEAEFIRSAAKRVMGDLRVLLMDVADIVEDDPDLLLARSAISVAEDILNENYDEEEN